MKTIIVNTTSSTFGDQTFSVITSHSSRKVAVTKAVRAVMFEHFNFNDDELDALSLSSDAADSSKGSFSIFKVVGTFRVIEDTLTA